MTSLDLFSSEKRVLSVSEITRMIKMSLESNFPRVWIQGEISNYKQHSSGHLYFTLKDEGAQIAGVMWRSRAESLVFVPADGMKVQAKGVITVYPPRGAYQIDVQRMIPVGIGELQLAFEQLKQRLASEGLFDPSRKKSLPEYPERIGVVTSTTGAALRDIVSVLGRRFPSVEVIVYPVRVQGVGAAEEIAEGIRDMNRYGEVDVLIVGRGGGSLEDLWAFNEETVARAIFQSDIPVVSAVGHEIDFSIADFVADVRAPTPSVAAELVVRDRIEILDSLANYRYTMKQNLSERLSALRNRIGSLVSSHAFNRPRDMILQYSQRIDELERGISRRSTTVVSSARNRLQTLVQRLEALGPRNVLQRGYALVRKNGNLVSRAKQLNAGDSANIDFYDGTVPARIEKE